MWANEIAKKIVKNNPDKEEYILNCGTSTTGISHIGNFREISIVYFVSQALKKLNKKSKIILSFDDFDRFKKVPLNVDACYEKYIGMPVSDIPSPFSNKDFAQHFEDLFLTELDKLNICVEPVRQSVRYKSNYYTKYFPVIIDKIKEISNIVNENKTEGTRKEVEFPFHVYCDNCNRDLIEVKKVDYDKKLIKYKCTCGFNGTIDINNSIKIKPIFKVEWPMRWFAEDVDFEASGKSHMTKNGAFDVSSEILRQVFGGKQVLAEKYDFVELLGATNRMSKTSGKTYTITDFLQVYSPKMLLWLFLKQKPEQKIKLGFGDVVLQNYAEYEKFLQNDDIFSTEIKEILEIEQPNSELVKPTFKDLIAEIVSLNSIDEVMLKYKIEDKNLLTQKYNRALAWAEINHKKFELLSVKNEEYISTMNEDQKQFMRTFGKFLKTDNKGIDITKKLKQVYVDNENFNVKRLCVSFYNLVFGKNDGPPISKIFRSYDIQHILSLLEV